MGIYLPQIFRGNTAGTTKYVPQGQARTESSGGGALMAFGSKVAPPDPVIVMKYQNGPRMVYGVFPTP